MKNKFLLCIRPVVTEAEDGERRYVTVSRERSNRSRVTSPEGSSTVSGRESYRRQQSVGASHKTFSQTVKAVLFEVTLRRSVRERNVAQQTPRSNSNSSRKSSTHFDDGSVNRKQYQTQPEIQQLQPISPKTSTSPSNSINPKKQSISGEANDDVSCSNYAMYFVVISLIATIFGGKIFGVLCTIMWLYMVPRRSDKTGRISEKSGKLPETEEGMMEYKKRVIMEGLLERNHRRDRGH